MRLLLDIFDIERRRGQVSLQPYEVQPLAPPSSFPSWGVLAVFILPTLVVALFWPGNGGDSGAEAKTDKLQPVMEEPLLVWVEVALEPFTCHQIQVTGIQNGVVRLEGHVESDTQRQEVLQAVRNVRSVTDVRETFQIVPWPFCEAIEILVPFRDYDTLPEPRLATQPSKQCDATYVEGEELAVGIQANMPLGYVYADYFTADLQHVAHLLPNDKQNNNFFGDVRSTTVGAPDSSNKWEIKSPFGRELVTVLTSPRQLFPLRPTAEKAAPYLHVLRQALQAEVVNNEIVADYCFITSQAR